MNHVFFWIFRDKNVFSFLLTADWTRWRKKQIEGGYINIIMIWEFMRWKWKIQEDYMKSFLFLIWQTNHIGYILSLSYSSRSHQYIYGFLPYKFPKKWVLSKDSFKSWYILVGIKSITDYAINIPSHKWPDFNQQYILTRMELWSIIIAKSKQGVPTVPCRTALLIRTLRNF